MPVYVVTGANRGLGLEFVRQLSSSASNLIIAAVRTLQNDLTDLQALNQAHSNVHILECDTGKPSSIERFGAAVQTLLASSKHTKIDYLINNSGINATPADSALTLTPESLHHHIDVNVLGPQKMTEILLPLLAPSSVVMNMTSGLGSLDKSKHMHPPKCTTYSISKAALNMLTVHQAGALKGRVKAVITMDPGWVKTRMGGPGAILEPHQSIGGMLKVIHGLKEEDTARFYCSDGEQVPW